MTMTNSDPERQGDGYVARHVKGKRELLYKIQVAPQIVLAVDDSHSLVLVITDPQGNERDRADVPDGDRFGAAVIQCRAWAAMANEADDAARFQRVMESASGDLAKRRRQ